MSSPLAAGVAVAKVRPSVKARRQQPALAVEAHGSQARDGSRGQRVAMPIEALRLWRSAAPEPAMTVACASNTTTCGGTHVRSPAWVGEEGEIGKLTGGHNVKKEGGKPKEVRRFGVSRQPQFRGAAVFLQALAPLLPGSGVSSPRAGVHLRVCQLLGGRQAKVRAVRQKLLQHHFGNIRFLGQLGPTVWDRADGCLQRIAENRPADSPSKRGNSA